MSITPEVKIYKSKMQSAFISNQRLKDFLLRTNEMTNMEDVEKLSSIISTGEQLVEVAHIKLDDLNAVKHWEGNPMEGRLIIVGAKPAGYVLTNKNPLFKSIKMISLDKDYEDRYINTHALEAILVTAEGAEYSLEDAVDEEVQEEMDLVIRLRMYNIVEGELNPIIFVEGAFSEGEFKIGLFLSKVSERLEGLPLVETYE